ncbi:MAG TPA: FemAB family XrtA/PEP-CTERM system-associated protein [Gammaproteobacteria bacterium]|nr:FemAB family XrtA/PEP-CTERM system-associated protein [Gammaproteobacteria bacterium]
MQRIQPLTAKQAAAWDRFVESSRDATFFHKAAWREVIEKAFGHPSHYLYLERDGALAGVLPLVHVRSRLFANALISTPFCVYGGAVAETDEDCRALEEAAEKLARDRGVEYLELRNVKPTGRENREQKSLYVTFRKAISADPEANLKAIPRKQRAMVRKGIEAGLQSEIDGGIDRLYRAYSESVRNLGTPVFAKRYFRILRAAFGESCQVLTVTRGEDLIASVMSFYFRDQVLPYYGGGVSAARDVKGNDFMYWELMRRAGEQGVRLFDYGRSKVDTGSYRFKKHWGFEPEPLHYEYCLVKASEMPNISPTNPKYQRFIEAWKRLPLPVTQVIGPWLARSLG